MRRDSNLLRRNVLVSAVIIIFGSCGADGAPAEVPVDEPARVVASGDEPAQMILLAEAATSWFLDLDPPPPPGGRVVIARGAEGTENGFDDGAPVGEANAGVIEVEPEMMSALAAYGLTDLGPLPPMVNRRGLQERSSIILAGHVASSNPQCVATFSSCSNQGCSSPLRCSRARRHCFQFNSVTSMWCERSATCSPCP